MTITIPVIAADGAQSTITVPDPVVNSAFADGSANAPTGPSAVLPFPGLLNGYAFRPPWKVAGVDYAVGPRFTPTNVIGTTPLPSGSTVSGNRVTVKTANTTFSGWDFTQGPAAPYALLIDANGCMITDCILKGNGVNASWDLNISGAFTGQYCTIDINGKDSDTGNPINMRGSGPILLQYIWIHNSAGHNMYNITGMTKWTMLYSVISDSGNLAGAHPDYFEGDTAGCAPTFQFNLMYQRKTRMGSQGLSLNGGPYLNGLITNNVCLASNNPAPLFTGTSSGLMSYFSDIDPTLGTNTTFNITQNYIDPTGFGNGAFAARHPANSFTNYSGNINMVTGAVIPHP